MTQKNRKLLLDATWNIREEYIEQAAAVQRKPRVGIRAVAAAAAILVILGFGALLRPAASDGEPVPLFAIRAYAADGSVATLEEPGDQVNLRTDVSIQFPFKKVYTLDVSLGDYTGDPADFADGEFWFWHRGAWIKPGEKNEYLSIEWLEEGEEGICGYRITGWCEDTDRINVRITDAENNIIHNKEVWIENNRGYRATVDISYTYRENMTTDTLIEQALNSNLTFDRYFASSSYVEYQIIRNGNGAFAELEKRADAPSKLLALYVRTMNGEKVYNQDVLLGLMLSQDVYWNQLTQEERGIFAGFGRWRTE